MAELDMPVMETKKSFFYKRRTIVILALLSLLCIIAGCICWLSLGKVSSVAARIDGTVYTVAPQISAALQDLYVQPGQVVSQGQELAKLDIGVNKPGSSNFSDATRMNEIGYVQSTERQLAERLAAAQREEEKFRLVREEKVVEHVRAQLAMRSAQTRTGHSNEHAINAEKIARANMEKAKEDFDRASKVRAVTEKELNRIRALARRAGSYSASQSRTENSQSQPKVDGGIFSPINGRIVAVNAAQGQMLQKGQPIFIILPTGQDLGTNAVWVQAWFPIDAKEELAHGLPAEIFLSSGLALKGQIGEIFQPQALPESLMLTLSSEQLSGIKSKTLFIPCRITLENLSGIPADKVFPGLPVRCVVQTRSILGFRGW